VNDDHEHCAVCERRYATATAAADAAALAMGNMAAKCSALLVERDELRATLDAERDRLRDELAVYRDQALPDAGRIMNGLSTALADVEAELDRLRAVVEAVRVMWDNIVGTADEAVMGFPVTDYNAIEEALDQLDGSADMGGDEEADRG
jgi:hypothetical protein